MILIGIDPGQKGAICGLVRNEIHFFDMPLITETKQKGDKIKKTSYLDRKKAAAILRELVRKDYQAHVCIEHIWGFGAAMRSFEGRRSAGEFPFARDYGALLGIIDTLEIPLSLLAPKTWAKGVGKDDGKTGSVATAMKLYPNAQLIRSGCRVPSDGRAEALLMAHFGKNLLFDGKDVSILRNMYQYIK